MAQMFEIGFGNNGEIVCAGRLDAAQCEKAQEFMDTVEDGKTVDFSNLEYISSAGLGVLLKTQKRLVEAGVGLKKNGSFFQGLTRCLMKHFRAWISFWLWIALLRRRLFSRAYLEI